MLERIADADRPDWRYAERWAERIRGWAHNCARLVVAPAGVDRAVSLLGVPRARVVAVPNGVDVDLFTSRAVDREAFWRRVLVEQPQGSLPGGRPGSLRYREGDLMALAAGTVLLYVGRFTAVKRLDHLIGALDVPRSASRPPSGWYWSAATRASGRGSTQPRLPPTSASGVSRRLARARGSARLPLGGRRGSAHVRARTVRTSDRRGHRLRIACHRHTLAWPGGDH